MRITGDLKQIIWNVDHNIWKARNYDAKDIFDIHYIARQRNYKVGEYYHSNRMYSMGYILREFSGYRGQVYCATTHAVSAGAYYDIADFKNNDRKIFLTRSVQRRNEIQSVSNKLIIPIGPGAMPYTKGIYSDIQLEDVKKNLGKTLLVIPKHTVNDSSVDMEFNQFADFVKEIASQYKFDTVLCCLYYADIIKGANIPYERLGWKVVTAGYKGNYDFADCLNTIYSMADCIIGQGYGGSSVYPLLFRKPYTYYPASRDVVVEGKGLIKSEDHNAWADEYEKIMVKLFGNFSEKITEEQWKTLDELYGYSEVKSKEQMKAILEFARDIENDKGINERHINSLLKRKKYSVIKDVISDALNSWKSGYRA